MVSVRLGQDVERRLKMTARRENVTQSEIIKKALVMYLEEHEPECSAFEAGRDLFGKYGSGDGSLSRDYKSAIRNGIREKRPR